MHLLPLPERDAKGCGVALSRAELEGAARQWLSPAACRVSHCCLTQAVTSTPKQARPVSEGQPAQSCAQ